MGGREAMRKGGRQNGSHAGMRVREDRRQGGGTDREDGRRGGYEKGKQGGGGCGAGRL